jgi:peptide/nickel transport system substrate-binding protein
VLLIASAVAVALLAAGCGSASTTTSAGSTSATNNDVLTIPYLNDISVPDPDIFYDIEGSSVILSTYEGLVTYAPNSTTIAPGLAASWTESPNRLTYTFKLRSGVRFHSGAAMTSADVKASFLRRAALNQASAYMVAPIKSMSTPDPLTFVVTLKHPVDPFIHYLASIWGPKVIGPAALQTHAGTDHGQAWMSMHEDGTGPYELTSFQRGTQYTLTRFPGYWGSAPFFRTVLIKIVPDMGTQQLQLRNGDLDAIMHSFPASELSSLPSNVTVVHDKGFLRPLLYVNTNKPPFSDPAVRRGLRSALNVPQLISEGYSGTATPSAGPYQAPLLSGQPSLPYAASPAAAKAAFGKASTKNILFAYTSDDSGVQSRVAELLQAQLESAGLNVTLKQVPLSQAYNYIKDLKHAPDLVMATFVPDAAHADTWARIIWSTTGGLNLLGYSNPTIDKLLNQALSAPSAQADALYRQAGQMLIDSDSLFFLGDLDDTFVFRKGLTGITYVPAYPWTVDYATLRRG